MDSLFTRAYAAHRDGRLADAEWGYHAALGANPAHADALHLLGVLRHQQGRYADAAELVGRAVKLRPNNAALQFNLGAALKALGKIEGAIECFRNTLTLAPRFPLAHYNLGNAYACAGRHEDAIDAFEKSLRIQPDDASAYNNLGNALYALSRYQEAVIVFERVLELRPTHAGAHNNLGLALAALARADSALDHFRAAIQAEPRYVAAHFNLGNTLDAIGRHHEAVAAFEAALALEPRTAPLLLSLGNAYAALNQPEQAIACLERAVGIEPNSSLIWLSLGNVHQALCAYQAALRAYDQALRLRPELIAAQMNRALTLLTLGDFTHGLPAYEWRLKAVHSTAPHATPGSATAARVPPRWQGEPINASVLFIEAEQGFGDTLQFIRFAPLARTRAARIVLAVQPELIALLAPFAAASDITLVESGASPADADYYCPLLSLPLALGATLDTLPAPTRYLDVPASYRQRWQPLLPNSRSQAKRAIGIAWSGRIQARENRAIALAELAPLFALENIDWIVLQPELHPHDKRALAMHPHATSIHCFDTHIRNFADTAAIIDQLDAVISVDTSIAHLTGALGKPLWLMLPFAADWRWFASGEKSPWYPSAHLIRQKNPGVWNSVVHEVAHALSTQPLPQA